MLVFSKTSFQRERISPQTPRALYFNEDVYVGFIPGAPLMEISVAEPKLGAVFYTWLKRLPANRISLALTNAWNVTPPPRAWVCQAISCAPSLRTSKAWST